MSARVLIVCYSQTGQMRRVAERVAAPLQAGGVDVRWLTLVPAKPYPFPWPFFSFFDQFPEAAHGIAPALKPWQVAEGKYDLVILAYTVWFLAPCPPIAAFVQSAEGRALLRNTPVVTLISCRNMWVLAQERMKGWLSQAGARHCDHIVLTDPGPSLATFITTPRWMLTGKTDALWGMPPPGLTPEQITGASRFGRALLPALKAGTLDGKPMLTGLQACTVDVRLLPSEKVGSRSFHIWGKLVRLAGPQGAVARKPVLLLYAAFLIAIIVTVVPLTMLLRTLLRPLMAQKLAAQKAQFELPSGSGSERMAQFSQQA